MNLAERTKVTFKLEQRRAISSGILEAAGSTFLLLTVVKGFENPGLIAKALVSTAASVGLLLTPVVVTVVQSLKLPSAVAAGRMALLGAALFFLMAAVPSLPLFVAGSIVAMSCSTGAIPLLTQIFRDNYPADKRGHYFSRTVWFRVIAAATFSFLAGLALNETGTAGQPGLGNYRWLLVIFGLAFLASWHCLKHFPSRPLKGDAGGHPFRALRYARTDKLFRHALICWMIMGFGNLMMIPIRVEYLTNPVYGLEQNALTIATLILVIPNVFRLLLNPFWGRLFDRINFFLLRAVLNLFFAVGILILFSSDTLLGMAIGQIFFGIAHAGGDIAWGLWGTTLAPPSRGAPARPPGEPAIGPAGTPTNWSMHSAPAAPSRRLVAPKPHGPGRRARSASTWPATGTPSNCPQQWANVPWTPSTCQGSRTESWVPSSASSTPARTR